MVKKTLFFKEVIPITFCKPTSFKNNNYNKFISFLKNSNEEEV